MERKGFRVPDSDRLLDSHRVGRIDRASVGHRRPTARDDSNHRAVGLLLRDLDPQRQELHRHLFQGAAQGGDTRAIRALWACPKNRVFFSTPPPGRAHGFFASRYQPTGRARPESKTASDFGRHSAQALNILNTVYI